MRAAFPIRGQWRLDTSSQRLAVAMAVSLLLHLVLFGVWKVSPTVSKAAQALLARVLPPALQKPTLESKKTPPVQPPAETPMVFVEVDPAAASAEPPKDTKFYSTHDTVAANPEPQKKAEVPKIDGRETRLTRLADNAKPSPQPLQPSAPKPEPEKKPEPEPTPQPKPQPPAPVGDLAMAKTTQDPAQRDAGKEQPKPRERPRTLREVVQRNPALAGQRSAQDGGVQRRAHLAMVDAKGSPFGDYDREFIRAVEQRWYSLLDNNQYLLDRQGKVVLEFRLHYDGRISNMEVAGNTVGDILGLLCQKSILDPAPFPKWPTPMRQAIKSDFRDVRFTFYYD